MNTSTWAMFTLMAALNIISPGPAVLLAISNALSFGIKGTIVSSVGNVLGLLCLASAVIFGMMSLPRAHPSLFALLKYVGVGYLIYLGYKKFFSGSNMFLPEEIDEKR